ncbi:hypothetical protein [Nocardia wallacei]|uniref:Uncharacterized protein n=1 Tax=Nocardia wallacei TaxID=480035 RepID=A0A7G1KEL9_9NOCA|nr:hypothetical protein [Nocardia wallacei]BCK53351.1 hypothetical protein NWFMUON74_11230 [Nocardia wallacei]
MKLKFLGSGGSDRNGCPTLYANDEGYVVQAWRTDRVGTVELPHLLLGFLEPDTFIAARLTDTGRGTFTLTGVPVTDRETLAQMAIAENETAVEVPKAERTYYGGVSRTR